MCNMFGPAKHSPQKHYLSQMQKLILFLCLTTFFACNPTPEHTTETTVTTSGEDIGAKLRELGISLPELGVPQANYVHAVRSGKLVFLAGKTPPATDSTRVVGKLGADITVAEGYAAARQVGILQLAALKQELGDLSKVKRIVKVHGMVNATPEFTQHSSVINGFSDLMVEVFGERGKHARAAVGMGSLPGGKALEIEVVAEVY